MYSVLDIMESILYTPGMAPKTGIRVLLREHRLAAGGMTQQELAERVGVSRQTILSIERGRYRPSIEVALALARVFAVPVEALFQLDDGKVRDD